MAKIRIVGDASGYVELSAQNAAGNNTLELPSGSTKLVGSDNSGNIVVGVVTATNIAGVTTAGITTAYIGAINDGPISGARNRIINGDMRVDQRNAGASISNAAGSISFSVDRWGIFGSQASKFTAQQNAGSVTPPAGFNYYLGVTSSSAYTVGASELFYLRQRIEGFNVADFDFAKSTAKAFTLSFWVRSSLTGTFGGSVGEPSANTYYTFSYTISSANTWEYKTITIPGYTGASWSGSTSSGVGVEITWGLGVGSTYSGTAGSWTTPANAPLSSTGATSVVGTNGATFYITGVQLEAGTVATPFERRSYGQELALCQRYCYGQYNSTGQAYYFFGMGFFTSSGGANAFGTTIFPVTMRAKPTGTFSAANTFFVDPGVTNFTTTTLDQTGVNAAAVQLSGGSGGGSAPAGGRWLSNNTSTAYAIWSAEL